MSSRMVILIIFKHLEKIYGSDKDMLSVVFFGTEKQNRSDEFHNVYALHVNILKQN